MKLTWWHVLALVGCAGVAIAATDMYQNTYVTNPRNADGGQVSLGVSLDISRDAGGSSSNPLNVQITGTSSTSISITADAGGSAGNPLRTTEKALCLALDSKAGVAIVTTPDAGQNCMAIPLTAQNRLYSTVNACLKLGGIPTSCSTTAVSDGVRVAQDSPEAVPITGTPTVYGDAGVPPDGGSAATHLLLCALPTTTSGVMEYVPYSSCASTP